MGAHATHEAVQSRLIWSNTVKPVLSIPLKIQKNVFQDQLLFNAGQKYCIMLQGEHSAILLTFIKLLLVFKIIVLSIL